MIDNKTKAKREITAGFIVYRPTSEGIKFLILYHRGNYWNFPKGHIEAEEKSLAAALRETREETGLKQPELKIIPGFKTYEKFYFKKKGEGIFKIVIFYLAKTNQRQVNISFEHSGFGWFLYRDAMKILGKYKDSQRVLRQAYEFILSSSRTPRRSATH